MNKEVKGTSPFVNQHSLFNIKKNRITNKDQRIMNKEVNGTSPFVNQRSLFNIKKSRITNKDQRIMIR